MIAESETRNTKIQKWCNYCGHPFLGNEGIHEPFCNDCREDES
jgi:hypothetical protein